MTFILLTGAGFSYNWGGPLASDIFSGLLADKDLDDPTRAAKSLLKLIKTTDEDVGYFEKVVNCIDEVDTTDGQTFRFPESIKGDKHLQEWSTINLPTLKAHNTKISEIAHTWHGRIEDALETTRINAADNA